MANKEPVYNKGMEKEPSESEEEGCEGAERAGKNKGLTLGKNRKRKKKEKKVKNH